MLSDGAGLVLDSLTFGPQSADISFGRCPDGSGDFSALEFPTFSETNYCPEFITDQDVTGCRLMIFPNPSRGDIALSTGLPGILTAELYHSSGVMLAKSNLESGRARFQGSGLTPGIYFILLRNERNEVLCSGKVVRME
jgi:hypothetical protein